VGGEDNNSSMVNGNESYVFNNHNNNIHNGQVRSPENSQRCSNDSNTRQLQIGFVPIDMNERSLRILSRHTEISLDQLEIGEALYQNPDLNINLNRTFIAVQLLHIITPSKKDDRFQFQKRFTRGGILTTTTAVQEYSGILMCRIVSKKNPQQSDRICYIVQDGTTNTELFNRNTNFCHNGTITIGSILVIVNPDPVKSFVQCIPMITSSERAIAVQPIAHPTIPLNNDMDGDECKAFVLNGSDIRCTRMVFIDTKCSGLFCDRQQPGEVSTRRSGCGCFSQHASRSCVSALLYINARLPNGEWIGMADFSSYSFMMYFILGHFSRNIRASQLQSGSDYYDDIEDALLHIIDLVNENGGWSIYGWGKKGFIINDACYLAAGNDVKDTQDVNVVAQEVTTCIVHIHPTNHEFLNPNSNLGMKLKALKFNVVANGLGSH
jgi:hypothetical protein